MQIKQLLEILISKQVEILFLDFENYEIVIGNDHFRIHWDRDTGESFPLRCEGENGYIPIDHDDLLKLI